MVGTRKRLTTAAALLALLAAAMLAAMMSGSGEPANAQSGGSLPAAKAAVAIDELIALTQSASADKDQTSDSNSTGWVDVLETQIKTSQQKDLNMIAALQTGVVTDNTVSSKNGGLSSSTARGTVSVRVVIDQGTANERYALPDNSIDANKGTAAGVVYQDRVVKLEARFSGYDCTADLDPNNTVPDGTVTCATEEYLQLLQKTLNAGSFNFVAMDVGSGVHTVTVQAQADASAGILQDDPFGGTLAGAEAFTGAGSLLVEEVRYVKGTDPIVDLE